MRLMTIAVCLLASALAGCKTEPAEYAATLSRHDPKWHSEQCRQMRLAASAYRQDNPFSLQKGVLLGPYGVGIAVAGMEHRERLRRQFARELHLHCSSLPLPRALADDARPLNAADL